MRIAPIGFVLWAASAAAQTAWSETKVLAPDGLPQDNFGQAVAIDGGRILVGARGFDSAAGAAYVLSRLPNGFQVDVKWTRDGGLPGEQFGNSVALDGNTALVGCRLDGELGVQAGAAYVYVRELGIWRLQQKLTPADGGPRWQFGRSVALQGDLALIGAFGEANFAGSAYVFRRENGVWRQEAKLTAPDRGPLDYFGVSVSLSDERALVGAYGYRLDQGGPGAAFVFDRFAGAWPMHQMLAAPDAEPEDGFGMAVSLRGARLLVGALNDDDRGSNAGAAYAFHPIDGVWAMEQKLTADDGGDFDYLGWTVALGDGVAVLGATGDEDFRGSAYAFRLSCGEWRPIAKFEPIGGQTGMYFSRSVAIQGYDVLVGAHHDGTSGFEAGAAFFYEAANLPLDAFPEVAQVEKGTLVEGGVAELAENDGREMAVRQRFPFSAADPNVRIRFEGTSPISVPARLAFKMRALCTAVPVGAVRQSVELYDFAAGRFVEVASGPASGQEAYFEAWGSDPRRFVESGTGRLVARAAWYGGNVLVPGWSAALDQAAWTLEP